MRRDEIETPVLSEADLAQLAEHGIDRVEAERQLALLLGPAPRLRLDRPCAIGDGIRVIEPERCRALEAIGEAAARAGRLSKFVPASGAASRMFQSLLEAGGPAGSAVLELVANLNRFAFRDDLERAVAERGRSLREMVEAGDHAEVVETLLGDHGLGYVSRPKGLLLFHHYPDGARTAFEEHLIEAASYVRDSSGVCRLHLTVSEGHLRAFEELLARVREPLEAGLDVRLEVGFSAQSPATDTLAVDSENRPFRLESGELLLRPGGHGSLIHNLAGSGGDLVSVKNIDNVVTDAVQEVVVRWKRILAGLLVELQERSFELLADLEGDGGVAAVERAVDFAEQELGARPGGPREETAALRRSLIGRLDRPMRVCGVVRNEGEPGGGPFWVRSTAGELRPQIVEQSEIGADRRQLEVFHAGTHFNPVDLACGIRDRHGEPYDLERFVDPTAVFIAHKSIDGRKVKALERPGLWNGAMARWNTVFVEVPLSTFAPVKTVFDLLRPAHQPAQGR